MLALGLPFAEGGVLIRKLDRPGAALIALLDKADRVILIDAMQSSGSIGQIRHFNRAEWPAYSQGLSSHGFGILDALSLARELDSLPPQLDLYGIEIGSVNPGELVGRAIQAAALQLARRIAADLTAMLRQR